MEYVMKSGGLFLDGVLSARIKSTFAGSGKKILDAGGKVVLRTDILNLKAPAGERDNVHYRQYIMLDENGEEYAAARPGYAQGEDPSVAGWPLCRMPRADHARLSIGGEEYLLEMRDSQEYSLSEKAGGILVRIIHRGLCGGWTIDAAGVFRPEMVCGIFIFCRYIEQENEFLAV